MREMGEDGCLVELPLLCRAGDFPEYTMLSHRALYCVYGIILQRCQLERGSYNPRLARNMWGQQACNVPWLSSLKPHPP